MMFPYAYDWRVHFRPGALAWRTPYHLVGNVNPPWLYWLLHPLSLLRWEVGYALLLLASVLMLMAYMRSWKVLPVLLSYPSVVLLVEGQVDALVMASLVAPAVLCPAIAAMKPQGLLLAAVRRTRWPGLAMLCLVLALSLAVWGWWPSNIHRPCRGVSLWPWSVPLGAVALVLGLRRGSDALLCLASLALSPYFSPASMLPVVAAGIRETRRPWAWALIIASSWVYFFITR